MNEIDVFKLACKLGFDVRGAQLNNNLNSLIIVNENCDIIPGFNSNKVIAYNCKKDINIKRNSVGILLNEYITAKSEQDNVYMANTNEDSNPIIDINLLALKCFQKGFIKRKKDIKRLYKKMY
ncbi:MAG: hypothetical protein IKL65_01520 [Bacilli bacterium]|nr:hypothetical protein [Bacilli bacterium]